jgi:acyl-CoA synthetase (AMP-forming)/AMP-acid ligase II
MANSHAIYKCYGLNVETSVVSWLPPYHDMGLIGGIIQPIYGGFPVTLMAPHSFIQSPIRWLQAISDTHATTSPSPNFGYDLCVRKITPEAASQLDLSHWNAAICGAEFVSSSTLEQFSRKFAPAGFRGWTAFCPSYGLAESTLLVSASVGTAPLVCGFDREALENGRVEACETGAANARHLVGNGPAAPGSTIQIVHPSTQQTCSDGQIGEVWTASASVAAGYWNKPEINATSFRAVGDANFLRTGDLGFFHQNNLFIAGRIKDLIILGGKNHFPEDLEMAIRESHPAFEGMPGAAFSLQVEGREILAVVQELTVRALKSDLDPEDLFSRINTALFTDNVRTDAIVLVRTATIPRTTSGKVQRHQCRHDFLHSKLDVVAEWLSPRVARLKTASAS